MYTPNRKFIVHTNYGLDELSYYQVFNYRGQAVAMRIVVDEKTDKIICRNAWGFIDLPNYDIVGCGDSKSLAIASDHINAFAADVFKYHRDYGTAIKLIEERLAEFAYVANGFVYHVEV